METLFIGKNPIFLPEAESTNSYALGLLKNVNPPEGTVIHTAHQTAGKGQRGSQWKSEALRNLAASIILRPTFLEIRSHFYLYKVAALACLDTISHLLEGKAHEVKIKWPNDILVDGKKICGILIENGISGQQISYSVVGIGINLNQVNFHDLPDATSYKLLTGEDIAEKYVLSLLCKNLEKQYLTLKQNRFESIANRYRTSLFGLETPREFLIRSKLRNLVVKGVSENGLLHLETEEGEKLEADVKEVTWIL